MAETATSSSPYSICRYSTQRSINTCWCLVSLTWMASETMGISLSAIWSLYSPCLSRKSLSWTCWSPSWEIPLIEWSRRGPRTHLRTNSSSWLTWRASSTSWVGRRRKMRQKSSCTSFSQCKTKMKLAKIEISKEASPSHSEPNQDQIPKLDRIGQWEDW